MPTLSRGMPECLSTNLTFEGSEMVVSGEYVSLENVSPAHYFTAVRTHRFTGQAAEMGARQGK